MKQSEIYRQNAKNCGYLAEGASNSPAVQANGSSLESISGRTGLA